MTEFNYFWELMCACYLIGGIGIGWFGNEWYRKRKGDKSGTGRWDYKDRHLGGFNE